MKCLTHRPTGSGAWLRDTLELALCSLTLLFLLSATTQAQDTVTYYTTDALGSVRMVTDQSGAVVARYDYRPFGDPCGSACSPVPPHTTKQFTGHERDAETTLTYSGARYYAEQSGRFVSVDPVLAVSLVDPQSWNRYTYVNNRPLNYVDPDGQWPRRIHNQLIRAAFPGLPRGELRALMRASLISDTFYVLNNNRHHLKGDEFGSSASETEHATFVAAQVGMAKRLQYPNADETLLMNPLALTAFGYALHAVMDSTSPAHENTSGTPRPFSWGRLFAHTQEESMISPDQFNRAVLEMRLLFRSTFGDILAKRAIQPRACVSTSDPVSGTSDWVCY